MSKAQVIHELGPPSAMTWQEWPVPDPGSGEVRLRHTAIGVNFADTYHRRGTPHPWPVPPCPVVIGMEAVGVVEGVGEGVTDFGTGDRVAYGIPPLGSYAEVRNYPVENLLHLPDRLDDRQVAALLLKGMTAHYLLHRTYAVQPGDTILVHAASGAMGLILCQWAKALGATVVGTVSTEEKAEAARAAGCDHPVVRNKQSFVDVVREVTDGEGAAVVYEAIGKDTLQQSLDSLRLMGVCAAYGHVSGPPEPCRHHSRPRPARVALHHAAGNHALRREAFGPGIDSGRPLQGDRGRDPRCEHQLRVPAEGRGEGA